MWFFVCTNANDLTNANGVLMFFLGLSIGILSIVCRIVQTVLREIIYKRSLTYNQIVDDGDSNIEKK